MTPSHVVVAEVFGPTVQGEGPSLGRRCSFVRLGRCNLTCTWCDTPFTWDWRGHNGKVYDPQQELVQRTVASVVAELVDHGTDMVVITGGEPLLQANAVALLAESATARGWRAEVETNGTRHPGVAEQYVHRFNVSPKLANSGVEYERRINLPVLRYFAALPADRVAFKYVVADEQDLDEVDELVERIAARPSQVWVMPEGRDATTVTERQQALAEQVIARNYNLTTRLHVLVWGDRRGV